MDAGKFVSPWKLADVKPILKQKCDRQSISMVHKNSTTAENELVRMYLLIIT